MSRFHSYLNSAADILRQYDGREPFAAFLKKYFATHKKFGSTDRKQVSHLCYCYFRTGKAFMDLPVAEKILRGLFLCSTEPHPVLEAIKPEWNRAVSVLLPEKELLLPEPLRPEELFPFTASLSAGIDPEAFAYSHLQQPDLFIRLRPGKIKTALQKLNNAGIAYDMESQTCLRLPAAVRLDDVLAINDEAVIQDYSSQRLGELMQLVPADFRRSTWDCCAASGGKSILAVDLLAPEKLTVTDIRESIISNLRKRFADAGIRSYTSFIADLSKPFPFPGNPSFSLLLADVPCSGSGTWGRSPEQLLYYPAAKTGEYVALQRSIVNNALPYLQPGGYLLYSTCSVFREENEEVVQYLRQTFQLELVQQETLAGYDRKADTMFAALLRKKE